MKHLLIGTLLFSLSQASFGDTLSQKIQTPLLQEIQSVGAQLELNKAELETARQNLTLIEEAHKEPVGVETLNKHLAVKSDFIEATKASDEYKAYYKNVDEATKALTMELAINGANDDSKEKQVELQKRLVQTIESNEAFYNIGAHTDPDYTKLLNHIKGIVPGIALMKLYQGNISLENTANLKNVLMKKFGGNGKTSSGDKHIEKYIGDYSIGRLSKTELINKLDLLLYNSFSEPKITAFLNGPKVYDIDKMLRKKFYPSSNARKELQAYLASPEFLVYLQKEVRELSSEVREKKLASIKFDLKLVSLEVTDENLLGKIRNTIWALDVDYIKGIGEANQLELNNAREALSSAESVVTELNSKKEGLERISNLSGALVLGDLIVEDNINPMCEILNDESFKSNIVNRKEISTATASKVLDILQNDGDFYDELGSLILRVDPSISINGLEAKNSLVKKAIVRFTGYSALNDFTTPSMGSVELSQICTSDKATRAEKQKFCGTSYIFWSNEDALSRASLVSKYVKSPLKGNKPEILSQEAASLYAVDFLPFEKKRLSNDNIEYWSQMLESAQNELLLAKELQKSQELVCGSLKGLSEMDQVVTRDSIHSLERRLGNTIELLDEYRDSSVIKKANKALAN